MKTMIRSTQEKRFWKLTSLLAGKPVPPELTLQVGIEGIPEARFWGDEWPPLELEKFTTDTDADLRKHYSGVYDKAHHYLAISGGGARGAFGAGIFSGWTASGTRPEFTMVTGISTGALTAPFAFLGSDYDDILKKVYTTTSTKDILKKRNILFAFFGDAISDTMPLKALIAKYFTADVISAIASEYRRGRCLYIGTVNLDACRPVIWDIGAIAVSNSPHKLELIHKILQASSAIPIAFPPVGIPVENNGRQYEELHVDGGTGSQVFVYPACIDWKLIKKRLRARDTPKIYVIRNSFLKTAQRGVKRNILPIAYRSIESLIRTQGIGDLYQIQALCKRDGNDFNLAYIPMEFTEESNEMFDPVFMGKLYKLGYQMARNGYPWVKAPPGFIIDE
jgi:predicted patatin/cPLA2 family phospholipase